MLGGSLAVAKFGLREEAPPPPGVTEVTSPVARPPSDAEWAAATDELFRALDDPRNELDPATTEIVRRNLEIIDAAVRDIRAALEADSTNTGLQKLLTAEYRRRSALMRRAAQEGAI